MEINTLSKTIKCVGTSITAGSGSADGFAVHNWLKEFLFKHGGVRITENYGIGGQNAEQICRRFGGISTKLELGASQIYNSPVSVTNLSGLMSDLNKKGIRLLSTNADVATRLESGTIFTGVGGGIFPRQVGLKRTAVSNAGVNTETYQLISFHLTDNHTVRNPIEFYPDFANNCKKDILIFEMCQNQKIYNDSPYSPLSESDFQKVISDTIFYIQSCVDKLEDPKRFLVCGMTGYGQNFGINSSNVGLRIYIERFEQAIANAFLDNYVNQLVLPTQDELSKIDYVLTTDDLTDLNNGIMPRGLMNPDPNEIIHRNNTGYKLLAYRFYQKIVEKKWY